MGRKNTESRSVCRRPNTRGRDASDADKHKIRTSACGKARTGPLTLDLRRNSRRSPPAGSYFRHQNYHLRRSLHGRWADPDVGLLAGSIHFCRRANESFPLWRDALTPLVALVQGLAITGTLSVAAGDAIVIIRDDGTPVSPIIIGIYGAATAAVGFLVARWLRRKAPASDLVSAEVAQWQAGAALSVMMLVGAVSASILQSAGLDAVALYIDPVLVLIASAIVAVIPIRMIKTGINELLEGAPSQETSAAVTEAVESVRKTFLLAQPVIRTGKVGLKLYVEVDFIVSGSERRRGRLRPAGRDHRARAVEFRHLGRCITDCRPESH